MQQHNYKEPPVRQHDQPHDGADKDRVEAVWRMLMTLSSGERARLLRWLSRPECAH